MSNSFQDTFETLPMQTLEGWYLKRYHSRMLETNLEMKLRSKAQQSERYTRRVAELLKYVRRKAGLSARELARRVGSSRSTILAYEAGKKVPVTTTLMRLVHACGYSIDFSLAPRLRGDEDNPKGAELQAVLDLAAEFPARHSDKPDSKLPNLT